MPFVAPKKQQDLIISSSYILKVPVFRVKLTLLGERLRYSCESVCTDPSTMQYLLVSFLTARQERRMLELSVEHFCSTQNSSNYLKILAFSCPQTKDVPRKRRRKSRYSLVFSPQIGAKMLLSMVF